MIAALRAHGARQSYAADIFVTHVISNDKEAAAVGPLSLAGRLALNSTLQPPLPLTLSPSPKLVAGRDDPPIVVSVSLSTALY